jgi:hypothetical protein
MFARMVAIHAQKFAWAVALFEELTSKGVRPCNKVAEKVSNKSKGLSTSSR